MNNSLLYSYRFLKRAVAVSVCLWLISCKNGGKETINENEFYTCSMDPQVLEKQPGTCPICKMPLAKVVIDKSQLHLIKLSDEQIVLGNIKADTVRVDSIWNERTLTGIFTVNQSTQQQVSSRFNGRIEKLYFKIPGQEVRKGDLIYEVYSRELMQAQEEYLLSLEDPGALMTGASRNKLLLWGITEEQIKKLEEEKEARIVNPIFSPAAGTITEIPFIEGDYINEGSSIFKLTDLTSLWVEAQVYTNELELIEKGTKLEVISEAFPDEVAEGEIDFSNPELQSETRINLIRIKISNKRKRFVPGMLAYVILKSKPRSAISLPTNAVIQSKKMSHVWIQNSDGSFEAKKVTTGIQTKSKIEISEGVKPGEVVVTSGAYLLYSDYVFKRGSYPLNNDLHAVKK